MREAIQYNQQLNLKNIFKSYPDVISIDILCKMLGNINKKLAYKLLKSNEIEHLKVGRAYKIPKIYVINYLQKINKQSNIR